MPKVRITVTERVTYSREVDMTDAEWHELDRAPDQIGKARDDAVIDMMDRYISRDRDWIDSDSLALSDLSLVTDPGHTKE